MKNEKLLLNNNLKLMKKNGMNKKKEVLYNRYVCLAPLHLN